jgi:LCP family protein required for cell wall assembly
MAKRYQAILIILSLLIPFFTPQQTFAAPAGGGGICNGPEGVMTILVIGTDSRSAGYLYGMADTVILLRADFQRGEVAFLGVDRGIWVEIPDVEEDNGRTHGKLTQAYFFGTEGMGYYSGPNYGAGLMQETFRQNWGVDIDHFIVINMHTFSDIIDIIGGIKIYNPSPLYSWQQPNQPKLLIGGYFFSGNDALLYARYRDPKNVYDRVDRQAIVLKGMYESIFSLSTIPKIPKIIGLYKNNVLTDLSLAEISQLACLAAKTDPDQVVFTKVSTDLLYIPDWESSPWLEKEPGSIAKVMQDFLDGIYPAQQSDQ